jgi:hypothetical protein
MVRYNNATIAILAEVTTCNDEGDIIAGFEQIETLSGDVQPHSLTEDEIKAFGIDYKKGGTKLFLYNGFHPNIKAGNRASVLSQFTGGLTEIYSIMPINAWSRHGECLLIPVENEAPEEEETENGEEGHSDSDSGD